MALQRLIESCVHCTATVYWEDVSFEWKFGPGTSQRQIEQSHLNHLIREYDTNGCLNQDPRHNIYVSVNGSVLQTYLAKKGLSTMSLHRGEVIDMSSFMSLTGHRFQVESGMHRLIAYRQFTEHKLQANHTPQEDFENELKKICWDARVILQDRISEGQKVALELVRYNGKEVKLPDTESDIWLRYADIESHHERLPPSEKKVSKQFMHSLRGIIGTNRLWECYYGPWHNFINSVMASPVYKEDFRSICLDLPTHQGRIHFFWETFFSQLEELLNGVTVGSLKHLTRESFTLLSKIKLPRTRQSVAETFWEGHTRNPKLFPEMDEHSYIGACDFLSENLTNTPFITWTQIQNLAKHFGKALISVTTHVCRWVDPSSCRENHNSPKRCVSRILENVWEATHGSHNQEVIQDFLASVQKLLESHQEIWNSKEMLPETLDNNPVSYQARFGQEFWSNLAYETLKVFNRFLLPSVSKLTLQELQENIRSSSQPSQEKRKIEDLVHQLVDGISDIIPHPTEQQLLNLVQSVNGWALGVSKEWLESGRAVGTPKNCNTLSDGQSRVRTTILRLKTDPILDGNVRKRKRSLDDDGGGDVDGGGDADRAATNKVKDHKRLRVILPMRFGTKG